MYPKQIPVMDISNNSNVEFTNNLGHSAIGVSFDFVNKKRKSMIFYNKMASPRRVELPTYRLGGDCSILLSYEDTTRL